MRVVGSPFTLPSAEAILSFASTRGSSCPIFAANRDVFATSSTSIAAPINATRGWPCPKDAISALSCMHGTHHVARAVEAGTKLLLHASAVNRAKVDLDVRLQILDLYRPFAAVLFDELDAVYAKAALPLGPRGREALNLARGLAAEIAAGYKI